MIPAWLLVGGLVVMGLVIALDLTLAILRPRVPSAREAALWIAVYVGLALVFALLLLVTSGGDQSGDFLAGWLTEYSLSVDNLFLFVIIMGRFTLPREIQQEVLLVGIIIALVLRGLFILLGVTLITHFAWIFYIFGAFLLYTAVQQLLSRHSAEDDTESWLIRFLRKRIRISPDFDGTHLTVQDAGKRMLTPILLVVLSIGATDLVFALDSIPAVFGITQNPFIVFAANVFALMGLRQLYFLLGHLIDRLVYLTYGIALILAFIAVKLVFEALRENTVPFINGGRHVAWAPELGTFTSLGVIVLAIALSVGASLIKLRMDATQPGSPKRTS